MNVNDLISLLQTEDPEATVVLWDVTGCPQPAIAKLGVGEVEPLQLGAWDSNGMLLLEPWNVDDKRLSGPYPGVALGSPFSARDLEALTPSDSARLIDKWARALTQRFGCTIEHLQEPRQHWSAGCDGVRVHFEDGSVCLFRWAFALKDPAQYDNLAAVFTQHCGDYEFTLGPGDWVEGDIYTASDEDEALLPLTSIQAARIDAAGPLVAERVLDTALSTETLATGPREALRQRSDEFLRAAEFDRTTYHTRGSNAFQSAYCAFLHALSEIGLQRTADHPDAELADLGARRLGLSERDCAIAAQIARHYYRPDRNQLVHLEECLALAHSARIAAGWEDPEQSDALTDGTRDEP